MSDSNNSSYLSAKAFMNYCSSFFQGLNKKKFSKIEKDNELAFMIDEKCFKVCMSVSGVHFYSCFDECEVKHMGSKALHDGL